MADSWTELWSFGVGRSRVYCGVARTEEGFAVDVFRGDWCIDSEDYPTRATAVRAALARERRYHGTRAESWLNLPHPEPQSGVARPD